MSERTITINGKQYDAHTGLPVDTVVGSHQPEPVSFVTPKVHHSHEVHHSTQKSHTLNRRVVKKATAPVTAEAPVRQTVSRSPSISKFAPHPTGTTNPKQRVISDIGPITHPVVQKAHDRVIAQAPAAPKPSAIIKQEAIDEALAKATSPKHHKQQKQHRKNSRLISITSGAFALLLLGGYFTYLNMPNLELRVAAAQAGVDASYPDYRPDGYSLSGPIAYSDGEVRMTFAANTGNQDFIVTQTKTNWDSSAAKQNYVDAKWGETNVNTFTERGLTIYTRNGDAAWVNSGILYTISGDAPLSTDQIRRMAASL